MSIEIDHMTKRFGRKAAVDDLTLTVRDGEVYAFLGPNGAGKTTTIKVITSLLRPTAGTVRVDGHDVQKNGMAARRVISYVPDQPFLYDKLSAREFLSFVGDMYGMDPARSEQRIDELSHRFGITTYLDDLAEGYSHGMKQRVVLAAAMLHDPRALVVDEPMVGLDPRSARLVKDVLREMAVAGVSVFMSTHTLSIAEEVADRVGIIHRGSLVAEGTVDELLAQGHTNARLEDIFLTITHEDTASPQPE
ncbi:MAG: ABC transporter ATP-binding protein [Planctomycetota bacterium]